MKKRVDTIIHGDSLHELKKLKDNSVDLLCTDPPYGYSFMGKSWDKTLPDIGIFKECHRVLKPGAFAFVMSAPRSDVCARMMLMLEDAGFEIGFTPIYWTYASGFPKAMNIGKMVDKRLGAKREIVGTKIGQAGYSTKANDTSAHNRGAYGKYTDAEAECAITAPASPQAKALDGSYGGFQPKPAVEVIIVAMKPLSEKTYVYQALKNGKGITWFDQCRIPAEMVRDGNTDKSESVGYGVNSWQKSGTTPPEGRFPANLLVSDDVLNDGRVIQGGRPVKSRGDSAPIWGNAEHVDSDKQYDSGSYSRYFDLDAWAKTLPFLIVPKASKGEKNEGLESFPTKTLKHLSGGDYNGNPNRDDVYKNGTPTKNAHPTVKPLKLMSYLITLGSRPGDVVLDPFLGSGTTAIAAKNLGRKYIGIEREAEYIEIARARLKVARENAPTLFSS